MALAQTVRVRTLSYQEESMPLDVEMGLNKVDEAGDEFVQDHDVQDLGGLMVERRAHRATSDATDSRIPAAMRRQGRR